MLAHTVERSDQGDAAAHSAVRAVAGFWGGPGGGADAAAMQGQAGSGTESARAYLGPERYDRGCDCPELVWLWMRASTLRTGPNVTVARTEKSSVNPDKL